MKFLFFCFFLFFTTAMHTAAPVVHVYFAELYLKKHKPLYTKKEREAFIIGTLFPDIRYIAHIERSKTHVKKVKLSDVTTAKNPFTAGKIFHSFVDEQREKIALKTKVYNEINELSAKRKATFLKMVEDELCFAKMNGSEARTALNTFDAEEEKFGIPFYKVRAWHLYLKSYLKQSPLTLFTTRVAERRGYFTLSAAEVKQLTPLLERFSKNKKVVSYVETLVTEFEKILSIE